MHKFLQQEKVALFFFSGGKPPKIVDLVPTDKDALRFSNDYSCTLLEYCREIDGLGYRLTSSSLFAASVRVTTVMYGIYRTVRVLL